jgi:hypothetical protein
MSWWDWYAVEVDADLDRELGCEAGWEDIRDDTRLREGCLDSLDVRVLRECKTCEEERESSEGQHCGMWEWKEKSRGE